LAAALTLLLREVNAQSADPNVRSYWEDLRDSRSRLLNRLMSMTTTGMILSSAAILILGAILCSLSRGGIMAVVVGMLVIVTLLVRNRGVQRVALLLIVASVLATGLAMWMGRGEEIANRFAALRSDWKHAARGRLDHWVESLAIVPDYWRVGAGLGTYRYLYPQYQQTPRHGWYYHAENQYLEALIDGGLGGLLLLLLAIGTATWVMVRSLRCWELGGHGPVAVGGLFALATSAVQATVDFNLYMPANALLLAVWMAMPMSTSHLEPSVTDPSSPGTDSIGRRFVWALALAACAWGAYWGTQRLAEAADTDATRQELDRQQKADQDPQSLADSMGRLARTASDSATACATLAAWHQWQYRAAALRELTEELGDRADASFLWDLTDPVMLHRQIHRRLRDGRAQILQSHALHDHLSQSYDWWRRAVSDCPLDPSLHLAIATLAPAVSDVEVEERCLRRAVQLAPMDPDVLFRAARLAHQAGLKPLAHAWWNRSLRITEMHLGDVMQLVMRETTTAQSLSDIFAGQPERAIRAAAFVETDMGILTARSTFAAVAEQALANTDLDEAARYYVQGSIARLTNRLTEAITYLETAVRLRPRALNWRLDLAELLFAEGRFTDAHRQASICLHQLPTSFRGRTIFRLAQEKMNGR
jgi:tetratricopeptide (TPR) repeat protein